MLANGYMALFRRVRLSFEQVKVILVMGRVNGWVKKILVNIAYFISTLSIMLWNGGHTNVN